MGTPLKLKRVGGIAEREIEILEVSESRVTARIEGEQVAAQIERLPDGSAMLEIEERRYRIAGSKRPKSIVVAAGPTSAEYQIVEARRGARKGGLTSMSVDAPMPGVILKILVREGGAVSANDPLIVLEAMKTETTLRAESAALIKRICVVVGQRVDHGATLIELAEPLK
ncbi:MAG TPA: biotin/lipoyl-containing protein [Candidatus Binataceae bacterium]|nr:biotin/lipoyl-containing protein [Candidatus Binataceae bacterium]